MSSVRAKVLIVDDSLFVRTKCRKMLEDDNIQVFEAVDGLEGLDKARELNPDVILLDIVMPKKDGFEVCTMIKQVHPEIPIIMVTTKADKSDIVKGLDCGADDYVVKPFKEAELKARVQAMLRVKNLYDKLREKNEELVKAYKELQNTKEQLREHEKIALLGQFMVGLHHEIRNPLTAVLANSQLLIKHFQLDEFGISLLKDVEEQAKKIRDILDQIKEMEKAEVVDYVDGTKMLRIQKNKS